MSIVLYTGQSFSVVREIPNHLDTDTNYVQAVIRNAYTDAIIDTIQLTDRGSQRFSKNWQVPQDPVGQGFYVSIVTSVYTDSGYTTKNQNYGDDENTYLVQDRLVRVGGGGGGDIDAYTVRKIIQEELAKLPEPKDPPEPIMRWTEVLSAIEGVKTAVVDEKPEAPEPVDFSPVLEAIQRAMATTVNAIEAKEVPETDISPIMQKLEEDNDAGELTAQELREALDTVAQTISERIDTLPGQLEEIIKSTELTIAPTKATGKVQKHEEPPFDINQLAS